MSNQINGLKTGIKAERIKRQIAELWIQHLEKKLDQKGCDQLCKLVDESGLKAFQWGDAASTKFLVRKGVWYRDLANYAKLNGCEGQISSIQKLIVDILFPLGIFGEKEQQAKLQECTDKRHHEAFWNFLKRYEIEVTAKRVERAGFEHVEIKGDRVVGVIPGKGFDRTIALECAKENGWSIEGEYVIVA